MARRGSKDVSAAEVTAADVTALARKYQALAALRARREARAQARAAEPAALRSELRALATEFPGCLRELDTLGGPELERRARACAAAAAGDGPFEPWMDWIAGYHTLMRQALALRRQRVAGADGRGQASPPKDAFEREVLDPPGGRQNVVVLRTLAARHGVPAATIARALFPVRRASPYRL
jgi:hypothetical protein